jgi:pimeloyl-ACP methyl ester carboxylesterase
MRLERSGTVPTEYGDIAFVERGSGPAALFVHGVFLNANLWRHVFDRVSDLRRCIAIDLLGHGATETAGGRDVSFGSQAEMLESVCAHLGLDQLDIVGHDSGGGIVQVFAARHPDRLRSLVLTNCDVHDNWPPAALQPLLRAVKEGRLPAIGRRLLADEEFARAFLGIGLEHPDAMAKTTLDSYFQPIFGAEGSVRLLERFLTGLDCSVTVELEPSLRRLDVPTLVVWATDDVFFPVKWAYWLRDTIPGCREVIELKGAKLFFPEERYDELAAALRTHWLGTA